LVPDFNRFFFFSPFPALWAERARKQLVGSLCRQSWR